MKYYGTIFIIVIILGVMFTSCTKPAEMLEEIDIVSTWDKSITQNGDTLFVTNPPGYDVKFEWYYNESRDSVTTETVNYVVWIWEKEEVICRMYNDDGWWVWSRPYTPR